MKPRLRPVSQIVRFTRSARQSSQANFTTSARCTFQVTPSRSDRHKRGLPHFKPCSTETFDTHINLIKTQILIPGYLNTEQRKLVYKRKYASQLDHDPTFATIGHEEVRMEHVDKLRGVPNNGQAFERCIELAKTSDDWWNVLGVLEGYNRSHGVHVKDAWREMFVRGAMEAGQVGIVIQGFERVGQNGLSLKQDGVRTAFFEELWNKARATKWQVGPTDKCFKYAQTAVNMMEHAEHCGTRVVQEGDPRADPFVMGVMLELAVRRALKKQEQAADKAVAEYGTRFLAAIQQWPSDLEKEGWSNPGNNLVQLTSTPSELLKGWPLNRLVSRWLPARNGLSIINEHRTLYGLFDEENREFISETIAKIDQRLDQSYSKWEETVSSVKSEAPEKALPRWAALEEWARVRLQGAEAVTV